MIRAAQWWAIANGERSSVGSVTAASRSTWPAEGPEAKRLNAFAGNRFRCSRSPPLRTADGGGPVSFAQIYRNPDRGSTDWQSKSCFFSQGTPDATSEHPAAPLQLATASASSYSGRFVLLPVPFPNPSCVKLTLSTEAVRSLVGNSSWPSCWPVFSWRSGWSGRGTPNPGS